MRVDFQPSPELYPFQSRWLDGIHYVDEGRGRPILLCHGNPTWSFLYRKLIRALGDFRCIAVDCPGHGLSTHPDAYGYTAGEHAAAIRAVVRHLDLRDLIVLGQDWGGPIGLRVAADEAERVSGVILGSTFAWPLGGVLMRFFAWLLQTRAMQRYIVDGDRFVEQVMRGLLHTPVSDEELRHYCAVVPEARFRRGIAALPRQLHDPWLTQLEADCRARLADKPALLLLGEKRRFLERPYVRRFQRLFRDHELVELPGAGHFFQEDAPAAVAAAVRRRFALNLARS
jgi:haloalkane dehalogenase